MTQWISIGKITKPHGLKGEVRVLGDTDFAEERFAAGQTVYLDRKDGEETPLVISSHRKHKQFDLLQFEGYEDINKVDDWRGDGLKIPEEDLVELDEGEYYHRDIIGCRVFTEEGAELGEVTEIMATGANDVWAVSGQGQKEVLIPYIADVVKKVDIHEKKITIHVMEGLLE